MNMAEISILLIRPQMGENIGAAARVMHNFGLADLRIVAPRDGWPNAAAEAMSAGAKELIASARLFDSVAEAVADLHQLYATTARPREMEKEAIWLQELPAHLKQNVAGENIKLGVLFGPERSGLENEDLALCDTILSVPVNPAYPSLNLAQAVALVCYELSRVTLGAQAESPSPAAEAASKAALQGFFDQLEVALDAVHFWRVAEKKPVMWMNLRNLFTRARLNEQEIRTLRGMIRRLSER